MATNSTPVKRIKKIKRKPKGGGKAYFTIETQNSIIEFQNTTDKTKKEKLYRETIFPAFSILVENLINVYKFHGWLETQEDLRQECVKHLYEIISNYKEEKGPAFAYFNIVAKHWLTVQSKNNAKKTASFVFLDDQDNFTPNDQKLLEEKFVSPSPDDVINEKESKETLDKLLESVKNKISIENTKTLNQERLVIDAIKIVVENLDQVDIINKRAIMSCIRDITQLTPKQLGAAMSSLKKHYKVVMYELLNDGKTMNEEINGS